MCVYLGEILANVLGGGANVVTKGAAVAGLATALAEELAGHMGCIYGQHG